MKDIHILPTDKPSRLYFNNNDKCFQLCKIEKKSTPLKVNQHIYITSDEEIKLGDWYYLPRTNLTHKCIEDPTELNLERRLSIAKIILTTDQDLIKDGVQAIDDEFLEWFVKNLSGESVEVKKVEGRYVDYGGNVHTPISYKVIIPQEEPKHIPYTGKVWEPPKKETLEEAAKRLAEGEGYDTILGVGHIWIEGFEKGAKWQAERSYSKEEVIAIVNRSRETGLTAEYLLLTEQFKKK